ncbi:hypothetical protein BST97_13140 [Nonlabens spongiae]|uniref:Uncharacterized protein n=1 Tax=Nonlabens spongiae TaxID=331648 RepID=A0A1W6MMP6_9FLAO|nr:hypothetical protein [Nonlabens spongiae]ARN78857.1 hypothetical protein BST97_13140 [Nonlabens spongiae]
MRRNFRKSEELVEELFGKNGNAFMITSTYSNFSQVWSYGSDYRERYNLTRGKVTHKEKTKSTFLSENQKLMNNFEGIDPLNCIELDGGLILIRMDYNADRDTINYNAVNFKCLFENFNNEEFESKLVNDIEFIHPTYLQ